VEAAIGDYEGFFSGLIAFEDGKTAKFYGRTLLEIIRLQGWNPGPLE
jgi:hypothetical protein